MKKNKETATARILFAIQRYLVFFLLMSFIITCCMILFLSTMKNAMGAELTEKDISQAAKLTFGNVMLLSLLCTLVDAVRRKIMIERPVNHIIKAAEKVINGDLSVRIPPLRGIDRESGFGIIADYFNQMIQELAGTETLRTDFIANVSHELKTPLAVIQNYSAMLQYPHLSNEQRIEYAKAITDASRRLADLITNILKLNKLENQQIFPEKQIFNLGEQLCQCLLNFENAWEAKKIELNTDIEENVFIECDAELLSLVWNNLFSNAIKFTQDGGNISVELKTNGDYAVVQVSDTGCGISKEVGEHIFEKFYQGDPSHATQGNGLGLALVKRVIDITDGDISVSSEIGKGSAFAVTLKRNQAFKCTEEQTAANSIRYGDDHE